jgi:hypothetical protein
LDESSRQVPSRPRDGLEALSSLLNDRGAAQKDAETLPYHDDKAYITPREDEVVPASVLRSDDTSGSDETSVTGDADGLDVAKLLQSAAFQKLFSDRRHGDSSHYDMADSTRRQQKVKDDDDSWNKRERSNSLTGRWERQDSANRLLGVRLDEPLGTVKRFKSPLYDCIALYCSDLAGYERQECILGNCHGGK